MNGEKEIFGEDEKQLDNKNLKMILNVSDRTLQRYRSEGVLPFFKRGQKSITKPLMSWNLSISVATIGIERGLKMKRKQKEQNSFHFIIASNSPANSLDSKRIMLSSELP